MHTRRVAARVAGGEGTIRVTALVGAADGCYCRIGGPDSDQLSAADQVGSFLEVTQLGPPFIFDCVCA